MGKSRALSMNCHKKKKIVEVNRFDWRVVVGPIIRATMAKYRKRLFLSSWRIELRNGGKIFH